MQSRSLLFKEWLLAIALHSTLILTIAILSGCLPSPPAPSAILPCEVIEDATPPAVAYGGAPRSGRWQAVRGRHLSDNPECFMLSCETTKTPEAQRRPNEVHHKIPVEWARRVGHPWLELCSQNLVTCCRHDHIAIGHGGNTKRFNLDSYNDMQAGKYNSRGISSWPGDDEMDRFLRWSLGPPSNEQPDELPLVVTSPYEAWLAWQYIRDEIKQ